METNGSSTKYGIIDNSLMETMGRFGFTACAYDALTREISPAGKVAYNTIFVRDLTTTQARCEAAPRYSLSNGSI